MDVGTIKRLNAEIEAEIIFEKEASKFMKRFDFHKFKKDFPTLLKTIVKAINTKKVNK